jgi:hypothetical protein
MFLVEAVFLAVRYGYAWRPVLVFRHTWTHSLWAIASTLGYWYAFWYGMTAHADQASIALGFLSLMIFGTPIALRLWSNGPPLFEARFITAAALVVTGVFVMQIGKANPAGTIGTLFAVEFWKTVYHSLYLDSIAAFLLVVAAQASTYVCRSHYLRNEYDVPGPLITAGLVGRGQRNGAAVPVLDWNAPLSVTFLVCLAVSIIVLVAQAMTTHPQTVLLAWGDLWIGAMAVFGLLLPTAIVNHLVARRRMAAAMTEPWLAVRPLIYVSVAYLVTLLMGVADIHCGVRSTACDLRILGINLGLIRPVLSSGLGQLFWIGALLGGCGFLVLNWRAWSRRDGFVDQPFRTG